MVSVKAEVVEIKKAEPIFFGDGRVAANGVVLVCHPHDEDDVKSSCRVLEKFRHDRLHSLKRKINHSILNVHQNIEKKNIVKIIEISCHVENDTWNNDDLPTRAKMTVRRGAAGKVMVVLNSNICRSSTMKTKIWCWEYLNNMVMDTVWK